MDLFKLTEMDLYRALLLVFRTGAFLMSVPVFAHVAIPRVVRLWLVLLLTFLIFPGAVVSGINPPRTTLELSMVILSEAAVGILMGFAVVILFSAVQFAGHFIGLQMGLAVATLSDPMGAGEISVIAEFYYLLSLLIFLLIDGHHYVLEALVRSFDLVPLGGAVFGPHLGQFIFNLTGMVFILGVKLSAPVIITLVIVNVVFGIVSRTVPQMNVFIVGFPLSIGVGLAMIGLSLPVFKMVFEKAVYALQGDLITIMRMLQG